jgi:hypothetical protein
LFVNPAAASFSPRGSPLSILPALALLRIPFRRSRACGP